MASTLLDDLIAQASALPPREKLRLAAHLVEEVSRADEPSRPRRKWMEIAGIVPCPLTGEDAQAWVSRMRRDSDIQREGHLRRTG
ncbi:MAG: hypothetical protein AB1714_09685 [Acidobacteriota bacterium]